MGRFSQADKALALKSASRGRSTGSESTLGKKGAMGASETPSHPKVLWLVGFGPRLGCGPQGLWKLIGKPGFPHSTSGGAMVGYPPWPYCS